MLNIFLSILLLLLVYIIVSPRGQAFELTKRFLGMTKTGNSID